MEDFFTKDFQSNTEILGQIVNRFYSFSLQCYNKQVFSYFWAWAHIALVNLFSHVIQVGAVTQAVYFEQNDDSLQDTLEESTHKSAEEDIASFKQITQPIISHFEEHDKLFRVRLFSKDELCL